VLCAGDATQAAAVLARRVRGVLLEPFAAAGRAVRMGASVGLAVSSAEPCDAETLLGNAEQALAQAKRAGGGGCRLHGSPEPFAVE
jgi:predicted signal transduction protein with EAL and GGDEF domain